MSDGRYAAPQRTPDERRVHRPVVQTFDFAPQALAIHMSWHCGSLETPRPEVSGAELFQTAASGPIVRVVSIPVQRTNVKTTSFRFPALADWMAGKDDLTRIPSRALSQKDIPAAGGDDASDLAKRRAARPTRIKPTKDIVKLEDRLLYLLQPPLESWMASEALEFPFQPFPYQMEGVAFLYPRYTAVLADEMGLGKTMQAITAIRLLLRSGELKNVLLICPKPLVTNWRREFELWAPEIPLMIIEGDQGRRAWQWQLPTLGVKIANYELLNRDREVLCEPSTRYDLVVLDESQRVKNRSGATAQAARSIARSRSWALTGTPVENSAEDLVGIFEFLSPGYLTSRMKPRRIGQLASEFVLRRTKEQVLTDLPPKLFRDAQVDLTPQQRESYRLAEEEGVIRLSRMEEKVTIQHVFELVLRLKQICNFDISTGESAKFERLAADMEEVAASGRKAIVFSQWVSTLEQLKERLAAYGPLEYHGRVPSAKRDGVIKQFKEDPASHIILMSYGAGSVGLNLQFAQYVFLYDRWWNPAVEDQAINRAHRIGAAGPVTVTRFLALNTIEERIDQILQEKREIFDTIFSDSAPRRNLGLTEKEVFGLFQLRCPHGPIKLAA